MEDEPEFPEAAEHVWAWYLGLFMEDKRLTYSEIASWAGVTGTHVLGWEAELMMNLDRKRWAVIRE